MADPGEAAVVLESFSTDAPGGVPLTVTDDAAALFSTEYGVWGPLAESKIGPHASWGKRIFMTPTKLREQCLPAEAERSICIRALVDGEIVAHVFASRWLHKGRSQICWITQLVVSRRYREQRIATTLLISLREVFDTAMGVCSSHPATIRAGLRAFGYLWEGLNLATAREHAASVMRHAPIAYIRNAKPHGALFGQKLSDGAVCCVDTGFYVDHSEIDRALQRADLAGGWDLGTLPEGHEFLLFIKTGREF